MLATLTPFLVRLLGTRVVGGALAVGFVFNYFVTVVGFPFSRLPFLGPLAVFAVTTYIVYYFTELLFY